MKIYEAYRFADYREGCGTLRSSGGDCGPGSEMLCVGLSREWRGGVAPTLTGDHQNRVTDYTAICVGNGQLNQMSMAEQSNTLDCMHDQQAVIYPGVGITSKQNASNPQPGDSSPTISTDSRNYLVKDDKPPRKYIVRRLTPLECCRLQGFPDWWEDGVEGSDSARYRMWGNGMALPNMLFVMRRIAEHEEVLNEQNSAS